MKAWTNRHETFTQPINDLYDLYNDATNSPIDEYNATTVLIQELIADAMRDHVRLRALGGGWSWTRIATTNGLMLNTKSLNSIFFVSPDKVAAQYLGQSGDLVFAQCGNSVQELNTYLKKKGRSLKTSGASNGQTIVGAMSTGTHGSAFDFGAVQDFIVGMHIIVAPNRHVWLERKSYPVASDIFIQLLKAEPIKDDALFNAALVSFGSFGFIHGVMLETEKIYLLECHRQRVPYDDTLVQLMETLDFSTTTFLPHGNERPFHFQVLLNPHDLVNGAYVTTMYKRVYRSDYTPPAVDTKGMGPGDDAPAFIGTITQMISASTKAIVNTLIASAYVPYSNVYGTLGEIFTNTDTRGKVLSAAIGIPLNQIKKVINILSQVQQSHGPFAGVYAFRFVKGSLGTLAFTQFNPTCIVELDGVFSDKTNQFYDEVWRSLEAQGVPHTFHWGKIGDMTAGKITTMYGLRADEWVSARNQLLTPAVCEVFTNPALETMGLNKVISATVA